MPQRVTVGPMVYTIRRCGLPDGLYGQTSAYRLAIDITDEAEEGVCRETLLHELMHACHQVAGIPNDAKVTVEQFIAAVSPFLLDALRRSPDIVAYILDSE